MLKEKLFGDLKTAMKNQDTETTGVLRMILAAMKNKEVEFRAKNKELADDDVLQILNSEVKKRKDAIALYQQGNRQDLADKELREIEIIKKYLPEQLGEDEIKKIVDAYIKKAPVKEFGPIMKDLMKELKGKTDAGLVSKILKEKLT